MYLLLHLGLYPVIAYGRHTNLYFGKLTTRPVSSVRPYKNDQKNTPSIEGRREDISEKMCKQMERLCEEAVFQTIVRLANKGKITIEEAAEDCEMTVEEFLKKKEKYEQNH